jgi:hypothetical protein
VDLSGEACSSVEFYFHKKAHLTWAYGFIWMRVEIIRCSESDY